MSFLAPIAFAGASGASGASGELVDVSSIAVIFSKGDESLKFSRKQWKRACLALALAFKRKSAYMGLGVATKHKCFYRKKAKARLRLFVEPFEDALRFRLNYMGVKTDLASVLLEDSRQLRKRGLTNPGITKLVAAYLLDQAPFAGTVASVGADDTWLAHKDSVESLVVYGLRLTRNKVFQPEIVGELAKVGRSYKWVRRDLVMSDKGKYFFHNKAGPGKKNIVLRSLLNNKLRPFKSRIIEEGMLRDTIMGGFVGARFGYPLAAGESLVSKSAMVGVYASVLGGPLQGLRWNWDIGIASEEKIADVMYYFSWSRASLGWAISFELFEVADQSINLDLTPRLNLLDFDAKLPIENASGVTSPGLFKLENAPGLGLEGAISFEIPLIYIAVWGASDLSGVVKVGDNSNTVTTIKGGVDFYRKLFRAFSRFELSLLVFGAVERITIEREQSGVRDEIAEGELGVSLIGYNSFYSGLGVTLQW